MVSKSWVITALPILIGVGFSIFTLVTGIEVTESHAKILDYLLYLGLGSGSIGAANAGFKKYQEIKLQKPS